MNVLNNDMETAYPNKTNISLTHLIRVNARI